MTPLSFTKEGRMQIEGGSTYTQRKHKYSDLVKEMMESKMSKMEKIEKISTR